MARPGFQATEEKRAKVREWRRAGVGTAEIARRLGTNKVTLLKYFRAELAETVLPGTEGAEPVLIAPPFKATPQQREVVEILAAARLPKVEIAGRLEISLEVLVEHFSDELENGPARKNSEVFLATYRSAVAGSNSAQRLWLAITAGPAKPSAAADDGEKVEPGAGAPIGKKVAEDLTARRAVAAGGKFAPPAPPKLVVNNKE